MAHHGREIAVEMCAVGQAVAEGSKPLLALAVVVGGVAALRDGSEVALFPYASIPGRALHTLYRSADANAAFGLSCRYRDNRLADAADRAGARRPRCCGWLVSA
jgi:hypothetical protein